ncbi:FCD domain-containing protein [Paenibacillus sp. 1_12]|uniref:GntR family transcriptional regulator n=1 Tax=Paenibacillus sp. 1_12 TaxID=1566278 RepID=UPI0008EC8E45|nr:GntR family transcriptional regulator [Paenibacillus sp. 1_12]SFL57934.1 FCD domain-containing protein [Paenibacillus sp. 1_12]
MHNKSVGPFERTLFTKDILNKLRMDIIIGTIPPETRIVETQLSLDLGVSRGPIRTALQVLEQEGLVKSLSNGGTVVVGFTTKNAEDMFDFRLMMEYRALELILQNPMVNYRPLLDVIDQIREINNSKTIEDFTQTISMMDILFHRSIMMMAENQSMLHAWNNMANVLYTVLIIANTSYQSFFDYYKKHKELSDIIIQRNPSCLEEIQDHIMVAKTLIIERLSQRIESQS